MNLLKHFHRHVTPLIAASIMCFSGIALADDLEEANKLFRQGNHAQALTKADAYLATKPKDAQGRFLKALILTDQGKVNDAIKLFSELTSDYPDLPEPYNNLAVLYASQGKYDQAKASLEMAIRTHPSYATAHENLGDIYAKMASEAYDRALQLDRGNTTTQTKLAMIQDLFAGGHSKATTPDNPATPAVEPRKDSKAEPVPAKVASVETKPAAPATPVKTVELATPAPKAQVDHGSEILKTVNAWAAAWSAQKVDEYLSFYTDDFNPGPGTSHSAWEKTRRERLSNPKYIHVTIAKPTIKLIDDTHASIQFRQSYDANHLKTSGNKTLLLVKADGKWRIQEERAK